MPKRKRSNGIARAYRRVKRRKFQRSMRSRAARASRQIGRPIRFGFIPNRIRTIHKNVVDLNIGFTTIGDFTNNVITNTTIHLHPNVLRDPDAVVTSQIFPRNFVEMASLYGRYRVNGVKISLYYSGLTNNENDKFLSCCYTGSHKDNTDPYLNTITDLQAASGFLQEPRIRKKMIAGSGTTGQNRDAWHKLGYFSMTQLEGTRRVHMDDTDYSGSVTSAGGLGTDPAKKPNIFVRILSPRQAGAASARAYTVKAFITFYVEWFDKREVLSTTRAEA